MDDFDALIAEAVAVPVEGWDFSWFDGRATEQRPSWGYARLVGERMATVRAALDVQTGGGEVLATVVSVLNPQVLVLAGGVALADEHFATGVREVIYQRTLPRATRNLRVVTTGLGESALLVGMDTPQLRKGDLDSVNYVNVGGALIPGFAHSATGQVAAPAGRAGAARRP